MRSIIRWATQNSPAMNTLMIATLLVGAVSLMSMRREVFPQFELEIILVSVPYPGASPEEVEEGICQKVEEAVRSVDGIKKQTSVAREGAGFLVLELTVGTNPQKALNEVRSEIDGIITFPELAEEPDVQQITFRVPAIQVGVIAEDTDDPQAELRLREMAEQVRDELLELPSVSQASINGARDYQIDIEISEDQLRRYGLTLQEVARIVRRNNIELPGGTLKTRAQEVLLRGKNKQLTGDDIAKIPVLQSTTGEVLTVSDLGNVRDEFTDSTLISRIDGKPALAITVERTKSEDLLAMADQVNQYVKERRLAGYQLRTWGDQSIDVADRMWMLVRNGLQGLALVFLVLTVFLDLRLAFWVALGIPIAILGAGGVLLASGQTLNMLSMFAFLMALGIVVDDAIVIGENVYKHREMGKPYLQAAIDGTYEVFPSVLASVSTTIIAFVPLLFVSGVMGKFIAVMPLAVIAMLVISLVESMFILPCHLAHRDNLFFTILSGLLYPFRFLAWLSHRANEVASAVLDWLIERTYIPTLKWSIHNPATTAALATALLLGAVGIVGAGIVPFVIFPPLDSRIIEAQVTFPDGTPAHVTSAAAADIEQAILEAEQRAGKGQKLIGMRQQLVGVMSAANNATGLGGATSGGHLGMVRVELIPVEDREVTSDELLGIWRTVWQEKYASLHPGTESLIFAAQEMGPGGKPIEFKLLANSTESGIRALEEAVEETKVKLKSYIGVEDVDDDSRLGKWEYQLKIKDKAKSLGVNVADLAETVRAAFYGEEVMRLQRGRHEVKLMVRYPREERRSLAALQNIRVRTSDGAERPLAELAEITVKRGYSEINRVDQKRSITVLADVNRAKGGNARDVVRDLQENFMDDLLARYPQVSVRWEGQQEQTQESVASMVRGFGIAILCMFALLTLEFRSYLQPIIIMCIIPFGFIGATLGHALLGLDFTLFSFFGMIALTGVVVNDSIVLVDFMNHRIQDGLPLTDALLEAGRRRFRPVILTSITTVAGLTPMLLESSFQAQVLIPMATSLCFGLLTATALILVLVPMFYSVYARIVLRRSVDEQPADFAPPQPHRETAGSSPVPDEAAVASP